jgi:hypothetical protein
MATRMQQRRGTSEDWTTANPILAAGEIGFETDSGQFKIGDGTNHWEDLSYFTNLEDLGFNAEDYVEVTLLGEPLGVATLDADGKLEPSQIPNIDEISQDAVNAALTAGNGISKDYDDEANTLTLSVDTDVIATKQYVGEEVAALVGGAPDLLNTLSELAAAIDDDENFADNVISTINTSIETANNTQSGLITAEIGVAKSEAITSANEFTTESITTLTTDTITPLLEDIQTLQDTVLDLDSEKQDKVVGVTDVEIGYLASLASNVQSQLDSKSVDGHQHNLEDVSDVTTTAAELNFLSGVTSSVQTQLDGKSAPGHTHSLEDITDVTATAAEVNVLSGIAASTQELNLLEGVVATTVEVNHLSGVTGGLQTQLDGKAATSHTHTLSDVTDVTVTAVEVNYLSGTDSNVQDQIDAKANSVHTHTVSEITDITVDATAVNSLDGVQGNVQGQLDDKSDVGHTHTLSEVVDVTASFTEVNYLTGTTSSVQDQLDAKQDEITGAASSIVSSDLTADRALVAGGTGKVTVSGVSKNELEHLSGVTSGIQSQLDGKSATGHTHETTDITGLNASATELNYLVGTSSSVQDQLDGKAASSHTHAQSDITDLVDDLAAKASLAGATFTGAITLHADPTQALHASTKQYVDNVASGILAKPSVLAATTANLSATYSNGTDGVGATLTASSNGAFPQIDGVSITTVNGQRGVLVKNQTDAVENGRYNLTTQGDENTAWVLTRCGLCDESNEIPGAYVFVTDGNVNGQTGWVQHVDNPATFVVGTDSVDVFQFSGSGSVTAGTNISVSGNEVSTVLNPSFSSLTVGTELTVQSGATVSGLSLLDGAIDDVDIASATEKDVLYFDGTSWVNKYINAVPTKISSATVSSDNYEIVSSDAGKIVEISNTDATTVTIPSDENFAVGTMIVVSQTGAGQVTVVVEDSGTQTLNSTPGSKLRAQWSVATLLKRSANTWLVYGDLVA